VDTASTGEDDNHLARTDHYDAIILDIMLPRMDGWSMLSQLWKSGLQTPVLFLAARDAVEDRVKGLDLGADDYLVKPFPFSELLARLRSILRRGPARQEEVLRMADRAVRAGKKLDLTPKRVYASFAHGPAGRGSALPDGDRGTGVGHEVRQRLKRRGCSYPASALQSG